MQNLLISIIGCGFIWLACDMGRKEESQIKLFSKYWWLQVLLIGIGIYLNK